MKVLYKNNGRELNVIGYGKIKHGKGWLSIIQLEDDGKIFTRIYRSISDNFAPVDNESKSLFDPNNTLYELDMKLDQILAILTKQTDPEELDKENFNDFMMNIIANLVAKSLEKILKI